MGEELVPKPKAKTGRGALPAEKKQMLLESAALAYVQMEHNDYKFPKGVSHGNRNPDGGWFPNHREVMRRAGYGPGSEHHFEDYLAPNNEFWRLVELYRIRYTDPMFAKEKENSLFAEVGNESLRHLYERVHYQGHTMTTKEHIDIVKVMLAAGITFIKMDKAESKADKLLNSIQDPKKREAVLDGYKKKLKEELTALEQIGDSPVLDMPVSSSGTGSSDEEEWEDAVTDGDVVSASQHLQEA